MLYSQVCEWEFSDSSQIKIMMDADVFKNAEKKYIFTISVKALFFVVSPLATGFS